jgi:hypothetical protein
MTTDIESARARLVGQELGLTDRPVVPDDGLIAPAGPWVITGRLSDGTYSIGIAEVDTCPASELAHQLTNLAAEDLGAVLGHARHVDGMVLYFAQEGYMELLGEHIREHQASLSNEEAE